MFRPQNLAIFKEIILLLLLQLSFHSEAVVLTLFYVALQPNAGYGLLIHEIFEITHTKRHSR
jgi:hypothetical protein